MTLWGTDLKLRIGNVSSYIIMLTSWLLISITTVSEEVAKLFRAEISLKPSVLLHSLLHVYAMPTVITELFWFAAVKYNSENAFYFDMNNLLTEY